MARARVIEELEEKYTPEIIEDVSELLARRDIRAFAEKLAKAGESAYPEIRYAVALYYQHQRQREQANLRAKAYEKYGRPHDLPDWVHARDMKTEKTIAAVLDQYTNIEPTGVGKWLRAHVGIGPIIAAGLLAYIDIDKDRCHTCHQLIAEHDSDAVRAYCKENNIKRHDPRPSMTTASKVWRFAGQDPTAEWKKGELRPWNANFKTLCWKIGMSWRWFAKNPDCFYGHLYLKRKAREIEINESGGFAEQAKQKLERFNIGKDTIAYSYYSVGKLPPAHIDARARRYAVKVFLANAHAQIYKRKYGEEPRPLWIIEHGGHETLIKFDPYSESVAAAG